MARSEKASKPAEPVLPKRKPGRPRKPPVPVPPKISKDELRAKVDKLERANETLRARAKAAKDAAAARIAELEAKVAALEGVAPRAKRKRREIDPGDTVPPGVAVMEPEPMDAEAETALENLQEHLHGE